MPVSLAVGRKRKEDQKFKFILGYLEEANLGCMRCFFKKSHITCFMWYTYKVVFWGWRWGIHINVTTVKVNIQLDWIISKHLLI